MSKNLKTFLGISYLIILIAFLYFIFTAIEISKLNDFSYYKDLQKVKQIAQSLGSKVIQAEASIHDEAVALISHMPVFVSTSLLQTLSQTQDHNLYELAKSLASSGFADTTRIGGGNPELGEAMAANNSQAVIKAIDSYLKSLEEIKEIILSKRWLDLQQKLEGSKLIRKSILKES